MTWKARPRAPEPVALQSESCRSFEDSATRGREDPRPPEKIATFGYQT